LTVITPSADRTHEQAVLDAWQDYGSGAPIRAVEEVSAFVSTNRVFRLVLDGAPPVVGKVSNYGSYFLFAEDHDRLHTCAEALRGTRFEGMLADVLSRDGRAYTWYDGRLWVAFYREVERREALPRVLAPHHVENLGREMAEFHRACADIAAALAPSSKSIKSDAIHLLELLESPFATRNFDLAPERVGILHRHTHEFLVELGRIRYDYWDRIPVLIDWNLGNFSVDPQADGSFRLFSRWDYDWFRMEPRVMDFYFCSRVSSRTGDRTHWTYGPHTLTEPSFLRFLGAYHEVFALSEAEVDFIPDTYRFFILNYVVREGARFFRKDLCEQFRRDAATRYLPAFDRFDPAPLRAVFD
jgi:Ser/Thr protein kinase RdoA (MazF antagonist)